MPTKKDRVHLAPNWSVHPGEILFEHMEARGLSQAELARRTGLTPKLVSDIIAGKNPVTARTAVALGPVLGLEPIAWLTLQVQHDLHEAMQDHRRRA
jgi:addiction module HigA family antidote